MSLHEFMINHRQEILTASRERVRSEADDGGVLCLQVERLFSEIVEALGQQMGADAHAWLCLASALTTEPNHERPADSEFGKLPLVFGAIASAVDEIGGRGGLKINAVEYHAFNRYLEARVPGSAECACAEDGLWPLRDYQRLEGGAMLELRPVR